MGLPNASSLALYGGAINDYAPVTDPTTDRTSGGTTGVGENQAYTDVAAMTHCAIRGFAAIVGSATAPALAATNQSDGVWGSQPAQQPTIARTGTGVVTATWPTTYVDELGNTQTINLRRGWGNFEGAAGDISVTITAPNQATINLYNVAGSAADFAGNTYVIFVV